MAVNLGRDHLDWPTAIWQDIDQAVLEQAGQVRVAQRVFPASSDGNGQYVPDDTLATEPGAKFLKIPEGRTRPYVELSVDLTLTESQVANESTLHTARTLAMLAAKQLALAEDTLFFRGRDALGGDLLRVVNKSEGGPGLLGIAGIANRPVGPLTKAGGTYGTNTFKAVTGAISDLTSKGQPGPYALILATGVYADTFAPVAGTLTTTADLLTPLLTGGFYGTGTIPDGTGLLVSLGGQPTTIFVGQDMITSYTQTNTDGDTVLKLSERIQIIARDKNAIVKLSFT